MRAQHDLAGQIDVDRVPDVARRVIARDVQEIEVVVSSLDFGTKHGLISEQGEDFAQLVDHLRDRMRSAEKRGTAGQGHVDGVRGETLFGDPRRRARHGVFQAVVSSLERVTTRPAIGRWSNEGGQTA
jgi:hypothetical protein